MDIPALEPKLFDELNAAVTSGAASIIAPQQLAECMKRFRDRFGPEALANVDGEQLLKMVHGRYGAIAKELNTSGD